MGQKARILSTPVLTEKRQEEVEQLLSWAQEELNELSEEWQFEISTEPKLFLIVTDE